MKNMKKIIAVLMSLSAITMTTSAFAATKGDGTATYDAASGAVSLSTEQLPTDEGKQLTVVIVPTTAGQTSITSADIYYINQGAAGTEFAGIIEAMKVKDGADFATKTYEVRIGGALANDYYVYTITGAQAEAIIYGDVNKDKSVDINDAVRLAQHLANWGVEIDEKASDVYYDNLVDINDAVRFAQYLANWGVKLGPETK